MLRFFLPERGARAGWRIGQLLLALFGIGLAIALFIRSGLGLGPWDAFHYGLHVLTGITVGMASILAGLAILCCTVPLGIRPGLGTVLNMILIGVFVDLLLPLTPAVTSLFPGLAYYAAGILLMGACTGLYIGAGFGHGPRDGLMMGLAGWTGWPVRRIRTLIEVTVLLLGWLMGGLLGIGTVITAVTIGPSVQWGLRQFAGLPATTDPAAPATPPTRRISFRRLRRAA